MEHELSTVTLQLITAISTHNVNSLRTLSYSWTWNTDFYKFLSETLDTTYYQSNIVILLYR